MKLVLKIASGILIAWAVIASIGIIGFIFTLNMAGKAAEDMTKTIVTQTTQPREPILPTQPTVQVDPRAEEISEGMNCLFTEGCVAAKHKASKAEKTAICEAKGLDYDQILGPVYGDDDNCLDLEKVAPNYKQS